MTQAVMRILVAASLVLGLAGCEGVKKQLGLTKQPPDEFRVQARAPLSLPPDINLRPPKPGTPRPQEGTARQQAERVVLGQSGDSSFAIDNGAPVDSRSPGEQALLARAGNGEVDPNIRQIINQETDLFNAQNTNFMDTLVFWREEPPPGVEIDAEGEAARLRENAALGKPVTEGQSPTIERRKKALFEGLF